MSLLDQITSHLDPATVGQIAGKLGIDPEKAKSAVASALPQIVGALAKNTKSDDGAAALNKALDKHDGSILEQIQAVAPSVAEHGQKILGHVFGDKKQAATDGVAAKSGLPVEEVGALLGSVAPVVMGVLGKVKKEQNLDAAALAKALQGSGQLDRDGDGDIMDDIQEIFANAKKTS